MWYNEAKLTEATLEASGKEEEGGTMGQYSEGAGRREQSNE